MRVLVYGIGNPGRQDDALGPLLVERLQAAVGQKEVDSPAGNKFSFDANYQLNVEDAEALSRHDLAVFADASLVAAEGAQNGVRLTRLEPEPTASFSTHSVSPGGIVALCNQLYDAYPAVYLLAIQGYQWEVNQPLTPGAQTNLDNAVALLAGTFVRHAPTGGDPDYCSLLDDFVS